MTSQMMEHALVFECEGEQLVAVLHAPEVPADTAVVVLVGGPQYRAGSHRQFVQLARKMAAAGFAVLRFDYRGMGDSSGEQRGFERVNIDIGAAIDAVQYREPGIGRIVLWGLCDAASAALLYQGETKDPRVVGLVLANPWVRSDASLARTHVKHYYRRRLMQREFWSKLLRGHVGSGAAQALLRNLMLSRSGASHETDTPFQHRMAAAWQTFPGRILLLLSEDDYTAKEFLERVDNAPAWSGAFEHPRFERHDFAGADHTFSELGSRMRMEDCTIGWLEARFPLARSNRTSAPGRALAEQ